MSPAALFLGLTGRVSRRTFWLYGVLSLLATGVVLTALLQIAGLQASLVDRLVDLLLAWPAIAISAKRWHDRDRSGWWVLVTLIPVIGWLWALVDNGFLPGRPGDNRFGADPLATQDGATLG
jgi:uncharacterized membrane protein YhaH (DUF805 family)